MSLAAGLEGLIPRPSPNHGPRRDGLTPRLIVLHYTAMQSAEAALERLCSPEHEVSAHYLIGRDGALYGLVDEAHRAWHAGAGDWGGQADINSRSIGIELDNDGCSPFPAPLMDRLEPLLAGIMARHGIGPEGVIAHSDFAPDRKGDPGARFDWRRLARTGLAVWPEGTKAIPPDETAFLSDAKAFGYPVTCGLDPVLAALRLRFRPWADGPLDATDMGIARDLAHRFPVDRNTTSA